MLDISTISEFGIKRENEERRDGGCGIIFDPETSKFGVGKRADDGLLIFFSGGVDKNENIQEGILREVREESGLYDFKYVEKVTEAITHYYNVAKHVNRVGHATCFLVILNSKSLQPTKLEEHEKFTLEWATKEEILANWNERNENHDHDHWIYFLKKASEKLEDLGY